MSLVIFDLDYTLINGDSDFLWGEFLVELGAVKADVYKIKNKYFYDAYNNGSLVIEEFLEFSLAPLAKYNLRQLNLWHQQFMVQKIQPILLEKAQTTINKHKQAGDTILAITATNEFIAAPIIKQFGIDNFLATQLERNSTGYSGNFIGIPCFSNGKVINLKKYLATKPISLTDSYCYSDSYNDLALLNLVDNPIAVNADDKLKKYAKIHNWQITNWID